MDDVESKKPSEPQPSKETEEPPVSSRAEDHDHDESGLSDLKLNKEYLSIRELEEKMVLLLRKIKNLKKNVEEQSVFIRDNCDKLASTSKALERSGQVFELSRRLSLLNRLCQRIDKNPHLKGCGPSLHARDTVRDLKSAGPKQQNDDEKLESTRTEKGDELELNLDGDDSDSNSQILNELVDTFEALYSPLEVALKRRNDLPYASYADQIRRLKPLLQKSVTSLDKQPVEATK